MEKRLVDFSVQPIDTGQYYGFTLDNSPLHQMPDGTIFHNSGKSVMEQSM